MSDTAERGRPGRGAWIRALGRHLGDLGKILLGQLAELLVQIAIPACLLLLLSGGPGVDTGADEGRRFLHFDTDHMIGTPLVTDEGYSGVPQTPGTSATPADAETSRYTALMDPALWRNRASFIYPSLRDTTLLLLSGLVATTMFACLLVVPALRSKSPSVRGFFALLDEFGLLLCCIPVFVAGFIIRLKVPYESRALYYCVAAITLGIGNLTLTEMVQMLRTRLREEMRQPYFDLIEVRGFTIWRRWVHRIKPYTRAVLLSLGSKVPILFSSVVIVEIILSLPLGGRSPIEKGLGLVAKEAAEAGDGITLLWVIVVVAVWIRVFTFFAEATTYFALWNPKRQ